ncbi:MAG: thioredoxin family protein [Candidatus Saccharibacteria bacterium]|nr:thioredoxin family protein [Candidatus Saccharibacteria bacterium]
MELYDFYADWCGPCQVMKPTIEEFEKAHPEVKVRSINIDEEEELAEKYGVSGIPCLVFLKDGEEVAREVGVMPLPKLEKVLEKIQ